MSSRVARQSGTPHQSLMRPSFLTSPPRWARRSSTRTRSIWEMPETPVIRADQNASRSAPIGVTTPAAAIATRSGVPIRRAPGVEEIEPLGRIGADHPLERGHGGGERGRLLARLHPDRRVD